MREGVVKRATAETDVSVRINLDGNGAAEISSGNGFFDHMLRLFALHSGADLTLTCRGDTEVDFHHSAEDIGISLGRAVSDALGDRRGIGRYGWALLPMDESLTAAAVDISGRGMLCYDVPLPSHRVGEFDTELCEEFWRAFAVNAGITLHIRRLSGSNTHHIIEGVFKAVARALRTAWAVDGDAVPSTKGTLL